MKGKSATTYVLWVVYVFLLAVLLPHTAWAFKTFEPAKGWVIYEDITSSDVVSYIGALAFEAAIAVLTHKLSKHIEETAKAARRLDGWKRISIQYGNAFFAGLVVCTLVSSLANLAHAIEFGGALKIFTEWRIPSALYSVAFGGILPFVSLLFARVLSEVNETEGVEDPDLKAANETIAELRKAGRQSEAMRRDAEAKAAAAEVARQAAEDRFAAAGDLMRMLVAEDKRERILAVRRQWPQLPGSAVAIMTGASASYVSEVINAEVVDVQT